MAAVIAVMAADMGATTVAVMAATMVAVMAATMVAAITDIHEEPTILLVTADLAEDSATSEAVMVAVIEAVIDTRHSSSKTKYTDCSQH